MPAFLDYCRQITDDLRTSWYFRVWAITWLVCAIVSLVAMAYYANTQTQNKDAQGLRLFLENPTRLAFPDFQWRVPTGTDMALNAITCTYAGDTINFRRCINPDGKPITNTSLCQSFMGTAYYATPGNLDRPEKQIQCDITTSATTDGAINFLIEGQDTIGTNNGSFFYILPNERTWILLTQTKTISSGVTTLSWSRTVSYQSSLSNQGHYRVNIVYNTLEVNLYEGKDWFTGWISAGQLGGFVFLVYLIHSVFMALVGVVLPNDSTFLNGVDKYKNQTNEPSANSDVKPVDAGLPSDSAYGPQE